MRVRILIIDDTPSIHQDFARIFAPTPPSTAALDDLLAQVLGAEPSADPLDRQIDLSSAYQGQDGATLAAEQLAAGTGFDLAFVDMRMPPGWDGLRTIEELWRIDPTLPVVICSAFSDHSWRDVVQRIGRSERLQVLKKPFDRIEVEQLVDAVILRRELARQEAERQRAQSESARHRAEMQALIDHAPALIHGKDADGRYLFINRRYEELLGRRSADIAGATDDELWPAAVAEARRTAHRRAIAARAAVESEESLPHADGARAYWSITFPVLDAAGAVVAVYGIASDVSALKEAERVLARSRVEQELRLAQKLEAVGQLAAGLAHEINTPIQFIGDNLRFVADSVANLAPVYTAMDRLAAAIPEHPAAAALRSAIDAADLAYSRVEIPRALDQGLEGVERVATLVRAIKDFSHPDQGEAVPTDLNRSIRTTLTVARNEYKDIAEVVTELDPDLPATPCNPGEFNQVVLNLVVNAAHAIAERGGGMGTITVSSRRDGDWSEVRISDTGCGIPEAIRDRIFDPFFTTKPVGKGTGQGLSLARAIIVIRHHGTLTFTTVPGRGTTFIIRLPLEAIPPDEASSED